MGVNQSHDLHVSVLLGQHPGCGSTVVSRVHFDSLGQFAEGELGASPTEQPHSQLRTLEKRAETREPHPHTPHCAG